LLALGNQWQEYRAEKLKAKVCRVFENYRFYDTGMIGISVILKHKGPEGESFLDYFLDTPEKTWPARGINLGPCAGLKTEDGVTFAHASGGVYENPAITMFFPTGVHGRLLISKREEKVESICGEANRF